MSTAERPARNSLLMASAGFRIVMALVLIAGLWLAVAWAMAERG